MANEELKVMDGTVIQGADGSLYFIPADALQAYRLPDDALDQESGESADVEGHWWTYSQPIFAAQGSVAYQTRQGPGLAFSPTIIPSKILNLGGYSR